MIDAHTHIQFATYNKDREDVIARAKAAGVRMITVGTQRDTSRAGVELAKKYEGWIYATVGLHPIHTTKSHHDAQEIGSDAGFTSRGEQFDVEYYRGLAKDSHTVAIGECGLDYFRLDGDPQKAKALQEETFESHIALANEVRKPLMLHLRTSAKSSDAYEDTLRIVKSAGASVPCISHFFTGSLNIAKKFLDAGFYFTFGGVITFSRDYDEIIRSIPLDRLLVETDAPYVAPEPYRGKRNEPAYVVEVAKKLSEIRGENYDTIVETTTKTAQKLFKI